MEHLADLPGLYGRAATAIAVAWPWFWPMVGGVLGAVMGSFLNCARYRIPHGISLRQPPSHCTSCHTTLGVPDLIPIFSFLALRGRCRHCGVRIGMASLWLELACALAGAVCVGLLQQALL